MSAPEFTRLNDPNTHRNKYINFISVLKEYDDHQEAMTKLCQLSAQVKPLMKHFGLRVNSLEECEWNTEFAGRNWNAGENIELVLRNRSGAFLPLSFVLQVFHHELAHCQFMNHVPSQHGRLTAQLSKECKKLQQKGYFGDGFWSSGTNLKNEISRGDGLGSVITSRPHELCGGALARNSKGRPKKFSGHRKPRNSQLQGGGRDFKGPSLSSGAQTAKNPTSRGKRLQKALPGQGHRLDGNDEFQGANRANKLYKNDPNSHFGKSVKGKSAREKIAEATERRIQEEQKRKARERRDLEEIQYEGLLKGHLGNAIDRGDEIEISDSDESDGELDSEEESERRARMKEAVRVHDSDCEKDALEIEAESDLEDAFSIIGNSKGEGKQDSKPKDSSPSRKKSPSRSPSKKGPTYEQLSEISRKAEGRKVGDTWKIVTLDNHNDGSLKFPSEVSTDEKVFGDRFDQALGNGRASKSNGPASKSASSPVKRKASTSASTSKPEPKQARTGLILPGRDDFRSTKSSGAVGKQEVIDLISDDDRSTKSSGAVGKQEVIDLISDDDEDGARDGISGIDTPQKPHFASSAEEQKWEALQAASATKVQPGELKKTNQVPVSSESGSSASGSRSKTARTSELPSSSEKRPMNLVWNCSICTLDNHWNDEFCSACDTRCGADLLGA